MSLNRYDFIAGVEFVFSRNDFHALLTQWVFLKKKALQKDYRG